MNKRFDSAFRAVILFQILTGIIHSLSLFVEREATNPQEAEVLQLMSDYKFDLGGGFKHSIDEIMMAFSICFSLLLFFSAIINFYLLKYKVNGKVMRAVVIANLVTYLICFGAMVSFTFLPPIICTGFIALTLMMSFIFLKERQMNH